MRKMAWDYNYDNLGRLTEAKKNNVVTENYTYDANGNRLTDGSRTYTYSPEDHLITVGTNTYRFDADGFLTQKTTATGTITYQYSSKGELLSVTKSDGTIITYDHDALGRRITKRVNGAVVEKYLWANRIRLLAVYDGNNNLISKFNYADGRMPVSMTYGGTTYYLLYDQVGSLRGLADSLGNIVKRIDYDSFGNITSDSNSSYNVPFGFAGGLHDRDTGLVRFGARDYDPAIGKWTAKDPIDFRGGDVNLFNYVAADPVNWIDPDGLIIGQALLITAAAVGIGVTAYAIWSWYKSPEYQKALQKNEACGNKNLTDEEFIKAYDDYRDLLGPALKKGEQMVDVLNETKPWEQTLGPGTKNPNTFKPKTREK